MIHYDQLANGSLIFLHQVMEDPLQAQRLKYAFESEKGLLGMTL